MHKGNIKKKIRVENKAGQGLKKNLTSKYSYELPSMKLFARLAAICPRKKILEKPKRQDRIGFQCVRDAVL